MRHCSRKTRLTRHVSRLVSSYRNSPRRLAKLLLTAVAVTIIWIFLARFRFRFRFDPEPQLTPGEAEAVAVAYWLPTAAQVTVARRIHFMYKGYRLNQQLRPFLTSWRRVYPDYKLYFWTDAEIAELVRRRYPEWQDWYRTQLSNYLERSDVARAFILHALGGWYADIDAGSLRRADGIAALHALVLPLEPYVHAVESFNKRRLVSNAIMYSAAGHPFWLFYLRRLKVSLIGVAARSSTLAAVFTTGPVPLTEAALLFIQAQTGTGCPGPWCPQLAQPVDFMPTYDDLSPLMREQLWLHCHFTFSHPDMSEDCERYRRQDYRNHVSSSQSYAYHAFMHLNEGRVGSVRSEGDVRDWSLRLTVGEDTLADIVLHV